MNADVSAPVGNNGKYIKVGEIVSVHNEDDPTEDAIYSWEEGPRWQLQMKLSALDSRVFDGGTQKCVVSWDNYTAMTEQHRQEICKIVKLAASDRLGLRVL